MYYINEYEFIDAFAIEIPSMAGIDEGSFIKLLKVNVLNETVETFPISEVKKIYDESTSKSERIALWRILRAYKEYNSKEYQERVKSHILSQIA